MNGTFSSDIYYYIIMVRRNTIALLYVMCVCVCMWRQRDIESGSHPMLETTNDNVIYIWTGSLPAPATGC